MSGKVLTSTSVRQRGEQGIIEDTDNFGSADMVFYYVCEEVGKDMSHFDYQAAYPLALHLQKCEKKGEDCIIWIGCTPRIMRYGFYNQIPPKRYCPYRYKVEWYIKEKRIVIHCLV